MDEEEQEEWDERQALKGPRDPQTKQETATKEKEQAKTMSQLR